MARRSSLKGISRRVFVHRLTFLGGGVVLLGAACDEPAKKPSEPAAGKPPAQGAASQDMTTSHQTFTNAEFAVVTALVDRVLPKDEDPGGVEANVPEYIDHALQQQQLRKMKEDFSGGVNASIGAASACTRPASPRRRRRSRTTSSASSKRARPTRGEFKWYEILITLTLEGYLGDPSYGGNKDKAGWKLMGFDIVGHEAGEMEPGFKGAEATSTTCAAPRRAADETWRTQGTAPRAAAAHPHPRRPRLPRSSLPKSRATSASSAAARAAARWRSSSARAGFKVVVLEKGPHYQQQDFVHDEILNSRRNFFMPLPWDEPHLVRQGEQRATATSAPTTRGPPTASAAAPCT